MSPVDWFPKINTEHVHSQVQTCDAETAGADSNSEINSVYQEV